MEWQLILVLIFGSLVLMLLTGLPVAIAFMVINVVGVYVFWGGEIGLGQLFLSMKESIGSFVLLPIPMFILLGEVLFRSGMAGRAIDVVDTWLGAVPGRLSLLAVGSGIMVSTLSGSGIGSTAMLGATLVPEMEKRGYKTPMSVGPIMGSGGIAMIIPPSGDIILLASLAHLSVGQLLMAGILPGVLMGLLYAAYVVLRCWLQPHIAPPYKVPPVPLGRRLRETITNILPIGIIIFLVIGLIFLGIATPSEAASMGALGAFILTACYRRLNWIVTKEAVLGAAEITVMLLSILLGAMAFSQILAFTGCIKGLIALAQSLPLSPTGIVFLMLTVALIMGFFMDEVAIMMMIIPLYMPIIHALGFNPVWFVILLLINMEMGLTTPPFGLILFVMKGVLPPDRKMSDLYKAAAPFLICDAVAVVLMVFFPQLVLWLPGAMISQ